MLRVELRESWFSWIMGCLFLFRNNLSGFWDSYNGTKVGAGSPEASQTSIPFT
jgi:hypothetical protein